MIMWLNLPFESNSNNRGWEHTFLSTPQVPSYSCTQVHVLSLPFSLKCYMIHQKKPKSQPKMSIKCSSQHLSHMTKMHFKLPSGFHQHSFKRRATGLLWVLCWISYPGRHPSSCTELCTAPEC